MFCLGKDIGAKRRRSETSAASSLLFDSDVMRPKGSYHATERELPCDRKGATMTQSCHGHDERGAAY